MSLESLQQHECYYLDGGMTVFLVENTLFKIPRYLLVNESPIFADMFRIPNRNGSEGIVDTAPIRLQQVERTDFERLLMLLYPLTFAKFSTSTEQWGQAEWKSILHLASMWQMLDIRSRAIVQLSSCASPTAKILLGRAYDHPPWVRDGYLSLCVGSEPLTVKSAEGLSMKEVIGVAEARERIRSQVMLSSCQSIWNNDSFGNEFQEYKTQYELPDTRHQHIVLHRILDEVFDIPEPFTPCPTRRASITTVPASPAPSF